LAERRVRNAEVRSSTLLCSTYRFNGDGHFRVVVSVFYDEGNAGSDFGFVNVAPTPVLAGFKGPDNRVAAAVKMFGRVPVRRRVAAADVAARQTQAQVYPPRADSQTILAAVGARNDLTDGCQMRVGHLIYLLEES
jgi:hypothetical protein